MCRHRISQGRYALLPVGRSDYKPASGELGYNGIVITDAMNMSAITEYYGSDEAAVMALKAGADMILMPEDFETAYEGVLTAVREGVITEDQIYESLKRIYRVKYRDRLDQDGNVVDGISEGQETAGKGRRSPLRKERARCRRQKNRKEWKNSS